MTVARTWAAALSGLDVGIVAVEADLSNQTPGFHIIGLADRAIGEAAQRVRSACANSGLSLPRRRVTVNLSPASLPKHGAGFDVAVAVAALATETPVDRASIGSTLHLGELGLDGRLRPVAGVLPAVHAAARAGIRRAVVPSGNRHEAALVDGVDVLGATTLAEVAAWHGADVEVPAAEPIPAARADDAPAPPPDLADVIGQREAVDALVVAAAGGHNMLMCGPPGAGKTMLARRLPGLLPDLDDDAALAVASVRSLAGATVTEISRVPPFEAPHHSASVAALVGGGSRVIRPGAIARASEGVLFLDEAGEFAAPALDALRQPLETGEIRIDRAGVTATFPARVQLLLATNPCPCGNHGIRGSECVCPPAAIRRYLGRLSGPMRDRMDVELTLTRVTSAHAGGGTPPISTARARARVLGARERAAERLAATPFRRNADVPGAWLRDGPYAPSPVVRRPLDAALQRGALTLRGYDRVLRIAWSVADLDGASQLGPHHVGRALFLKKGIAS
ncbi:YifB family Mg chelatase-like AAA ATPase [Microbacter sp. GSS18]|nr:YifB family Mg chelatase-like AAA ATPase [Microbacter sp. GSS18]